MRFSFFGFFSQKKREERPVLKTICIDPGFCVFRKEKTSTPFAIQRGVLVGNENSEFWWFAGAGSSAVAAGTAAAFPTALLCTYTAHCQYYGCSNQCQQQKIHCTHVWLLTKADQSGVPAMLPPRQYSTARALRPGTSCGPAPALWRQLTRRRECTKD